MMMDTTLRSLSALPQIDPAALNRGDDATRIKAVSKALENVFTSQLTAEMTKGLDGSSDDQQGGQYSDFINQAMTQGMSQGGGIGLAKTIEDFLNKRNEAPVGHLPLKTPNNSYHVNRAD